MSILLNYNKMISTMPKRYLDYLYRDHVSEDVVLELAAYDKDLTIEQKMFVAFLIGEERQRQSDMNNEVDGF